MLHADSRLPPCPLEHLIRFADSGQLLTLLNQRGAPLPTTPPAQTPVSDAGSRNAAATEDEAAEPDGPSTPKMATLYPGRLMAQPLDLPETPAPRRREAVTAQAVALDIVRDKLAEVVKRTVQNKLVGVLLNSELDAWLQRTAQREEERHAREQEARRAREEEERRRREEEERRRGPAHPQYTSNRSGVSEHETQPRRTAESNGGAAAPVGDVSGGEDDDMEVVVQDSDGEAIEMTDEERAAAARAGRASGSGRTGRGDGRVGSGSIKQQEDTRQPGTEEREADGENGVTAIEEELARQALEKHRAEQRRKEEEKRKREADSALRQEKGEKSGREAEVADEAGEATRGRKGSALTSDEGRAEPSEAVAGRGAESIAPGEETEAGGAQGKEQASGAARLDGGSDERETNADGETGRQGQESGAAEGGRKGKGKKKGAKGKGKSKTATEVYASDEREGGGREEPGDTSPNEGDANADGEPGTAAEAQTEKKGGRPKKGGGKEKGSLPDEERRARLVEQLKAARERKAQIKKDKEAAAGTHEKRGRENGHAEEEWAEQAGGKRRRANAEASDSPELLLVQSAREERNGMANEDAGLTSAVPDFHVYSRKGKKQRKGLEMASELLRQSGIGEAANSGGGKLRGQTKETGEGRSLGVQGDSEALTDAATGDHERGVSARTHAPNGVRRPGKRKGEGQEAEAEGKPAGKKGNRKGAPFATPPSSDGRGDKKGGAAAALEGTPGRVAFFAQFSATVVKSLFWPALVLRG